MNIMNKYFLVFFLILFTNCVTYRVPPYSLSKKNILDVKRLKLNNPNFKIRLGDFQENPSIQVYCNTSTELKANPDYASYIREGLKDELEVAEVYDEGANIVLSAKLSFVLGRFLNGKRKFVMDVSLNNTKNFSVESDFNPTWIIFNGCYSDPEKILPTIQTLISEIFNHPEFIQFTKEIK